MSDFELVTLRNGRRAVRARASGEIMHPAVGPWDEANLLYVEQSGLAQRLAQEHPSALRVYDVGLGGGANAAAALACADTHPRRPLELVSFERTLEPFRLALADREGFPFLTPWRGAAESLLATGIWSDRHVAWSLFEGDLLEQLPLAPTPADLVFFDPFSPSANPSLWTASALRELWSRMRQDGPGAQLFTYSAATPTRVSMLLAGFYVGAGVGVASKGETTVASTRLEALAAPLGERWLARWRRSSNRGPHGQPFSPAIEAAILGHPQFARG